MTRALALLAVAACGSAAPSAPIGKEAPACLADRAPDPLPPPRNPSECAGAEPECRRACSGGDASACVGLAYLFEAGDRPQAFAFYQRSCILGSAIGCTNYGAHALNDPAVTEEMQVCATRLHRRACEAGDPWGCGMLGKAMIDGVGVTADPAAGERLLRDSCERYGSFACTVLAQWTRDPALMQRACDTGDPGACAAVQPADGR